MPDHVRTGLLCDTGMGTTPGMWEMVSDLLDGEPLPSSVNDALYALREGRATVVLLAESGGSREGG